MFNKGLIPKEQLQETYLSGFRENVTGRPPSGKVFNSYFFDGLRYLESFEPFPYKTEATEVKAEFDIDGIPLVGFIDYVGRAEDGSLVIVDNKSRALKSRSKRDKPTKTDLELDKYLTQLYLYSEAVKKLYGVFPKTLCFNCFRTNMLIREPFRKEAYDNAVGWFKGVVSDAANADKFPPSAEWFKCRFLCDCRDACVYYDIATKGGQTTVPNENLNNKLNFLFSSWSL